MATYEFRCEQCRTTFTVSQAMSAHRPKGPACPKCKSKDTRQVLSTFFAKTIRKS